MPDLHQCMLLCLVVWSFRRVIPCLVYFSSIWEFDKLLQDVFSKGDCIIWFTKLTTKVILGCACDKQIYFPTNFLYRFVFIGTHSLSSPSFFIRTDWSVCWFTPVHPISLRSLKEVKDILSFFYRATSIPKKYHRVIKSLIPNVDDRESFNRFISSMSSPVRIISSTYTIGIVIFPSCEYIVNIIYLFGLEYTLDF